MKKNNRIYDHIEITDLKDMLNKTKEMYADKTAYKLRGEKSGEYINISHREIRDIIDALGTALIDMGLKGKRVAVIGENRLEWEIAYLSIVCGTGIVVPLDKSLPANELENLIERSNVEAIFFTEKYGKILEDIKLRGVGKLKHLISMDLVTHAKGVYSEKELIEKGRVLVKEGNKEFINAKINPTEMSIMLFTSGTTSASKIVKLSHKNITSNIMDLASTLDINSDDVFLSFLPLHHVFECTVGFLFSLYKGTQTVFCDGMRHIVDNMCEYHVTVMASVPAIYERIYKIMRNEVEKTGCLEKVLNAEEAHKNDTMEEKKKIFQEVHNIIGGNVRLLISGAASLDKSIEQKYRDLGINIVQGYGLTETSPVVAMGNKVNYKVGSIGKAVPSVLVDLVDCDKNGMGELIVKGPSVMIGYFENEEATNEAIIDGWFYTGDLAVIDEEGYIFIKGRKKNVIVLKNGKNIFPEEIENLINRIEGVEESLIFGKQVSEDENDIKIFVKVIYNKEVMLNTYKITEKEIEQVLNDKVKEINKTMPTYKSIRGVIVGTNPLIKTTTGKVKRQENIRIMKENNEC